MIKVGIVAGLIVLVCSLALNAEIRSYRDAESLGMAIATAHAIQGRGETDPHLIKSEIRRGTATTILIYSIGLAGAIGLFFRQRWARNATLAFATLMVCLSLYRVIAHWHPVVLRQLIGTTVVSGIVWWALLSARDVFQLRPARSSARAREREPAGVR